LTKNWMVWPWVQMGNFKFVPLEHRVLVVNVISLGEWVCFSLERRMGSEEGLGVDACLTTDAGNC
jgi:protein Mpv17